MYKPLIFLLLLICNFVLAQERSRYEPYDRTERQSKYPFNKTKSARLVSFGIANRDMNEQGVFRVPLKNGVADLSLMDEVVDIPITDLDSIADILLNTCHRLDSFTTRYMLCNIPRNAVLFYDSAGKNFEYLEICFECQKLNPASSLFFFDSLICDDVYKNLQSFFRRRGLNTSAKKLTDELHQLDKFERENPDNFIVIDKKKMRKVVAEVKRRFRRMDKYKGLNQLDLIFYYPERVEKEDLAVIITVKYKNRALVRFYAMFPHYRVRDEVTHLSN
jgi:hypothetical protein